MRKPKVLLCSAVAIALTCLPSVARSDGTPSPVDPPTPPATTKDVSDPGVIEVNEAYTNLSKVLDRYPETVGVVNVDYNSKTLTVNYDKTSPKAPDFIADLKKSDAGVVTVRAKASSFSMTKLEDIATKLAQSPDQAKAIFGVKPLLVEFNDEGLHAILPEGTQRTAVDTAKASSMLGVPTRLSFAPAKEYPDDMFSFAAGTAAVDQSPWSGGAHLMGPSTTFGSSRCTSGWGMGQVDHPRANGFHRVSLLLAGWVLDRKLLHRRL